MPVDAPAVTTTTSTPTAQGTPNAATETKKPDPAPVQAAPEAKPSSAPPEASKDAKPKEEAKTEPVKDGPPAETPKPEAKADEKKPEPKAEEKKDDAPKEVVYDLKLAKETLVKPEELENVKAYSKAKGYTVEQAQAIADYFDASRSEMRKMVDGKWLEECKSHPVYGKEKFPETCENIKRFIDSAAPKLKPLLDGEGFIHKPEVFEFFAELAGKAAPDTIVNAKQSVQQDNRTPLQRLEDDINKNWIKGGK